MVSAGGIFSGLCCRSSLYVAAWQCVCATADRDGCRLLCCLIAHPVREGDPFLWTSNGRVCMLCDSAFFLVSENKAPGKVLEFYWLFKMRCVL